MEPPEYNKYPPDSFSRGCAILVIIAAMLVAAAMINFLWTLNDFLIS